MNEVLAADKPTMTAASIINPSPLTGEGAAVASVNAAENKPNWPLVTLSEVKTTITQGNDTSQADTKDSVPLTLIVSSYERTTPLYETYIQGSTLPGATVVLSKPGYKVDLIADASGNFIFTNVPLDDGANLFMLKVSSESLTGSRELLIKGGRYYELNLTGLAYVEGQLVQVGQSGQVGERILKTNSVAALYADATLAGSYRLIMAYNGRKPLSATAVSTQHLGDSSTSEYLAKSSGTGYFKLEKDKTQLIWGDYTTLLSGGEFSAYNRYLTGPKFSSEGRAGDFTWSTSLYTAQTATVPIAETIPGRGISGFYLLKNQAITSGSDQVSLVTIDPNRPDVPVSVQPMKRGVDYSIDYVYGTILFQRPVPAHDTLLRPVVISVTYEVVPDGWLVGRVTGGRLGFSAKSGITVGITSVNERGGRPYSLAAIDTSIPLRNGVQVATEVGFSQQSNMPCNGITGCGAFKFEIKKDKATSQTNWHVGYRAAGRYFSVQAGAPEVTDTVAAAAVNNQQLNLDLSTLVWGLHSTLALGWKSEKQDAELRRDTSQGSVSLSKTWFDKLTWRSSVNGNYSLLAQAIDQASVVDASGYVKVNSGLRYQFNNRVGVGLVREVVAPIDKASDFTGTSGLQADIGIDERTEANFGWHRADDGQTGVALGIRSKLVEQAGASANLFTEYEVAGGNSGLQGQGNIGIDAAWQVHKNLRLDLGYQANNPSGLGLYQANSPLPPTTRMNASWWGWEFLPDGGPKLTGRVETGHSGSAITRLISLGGLARLTTDLSGQIKGVWGKTDVTGDDAVNTTSRLEQDIQLSYRPVNVSGLIALLDYKRNRIGTFEEDAQSLGNSVLELRDIAELGVETAMVLTPQWELGLRYAGRYVYDNDKTGIATSTFSRLRQGRVSYAFIPAWQITIEGRLIDQPVTSSWRNGLAVAVARDIEAQLPDQLSLWRDGWRMEAGYRYLGSGDISPWDWENGPYIKIGKRF